MKKLSLLLGLLMPLLVSAQNCSVDWSKVAGGGGSTSSNGQYTVSGTIGERDAGGQITGGNYSLTGGFRALISMLQTPDGTTLCISQSGNTVTVCWQSVTSWSLEQNNDLAAPAGWPTKRSWTISNATNSLSLVLRIENLRFRLQHP